MREGYRQTAVFLDRDGTINEEVGYMDRLEKLKLIPVAAGAIRLINSSGMRAVVVTNQSGVGRGYFPLSEVEAVHAHLLGRLAGDGVRIDRIYIAPEAPDRRFDGDGTDVGRHPA